MMRRSRLSHVDDDRPQRTQVTAVINASDFSPRFLLELTTGVRRGQVCGLKWSAVDLEGGQITLHDNRVVVGGKVLDKAGGKTRNADKTISLDGVTLAELRE